MEIQCVIALSLLILNDALVWCVQIDFNFKAMLFYQHFSVDLNFGPMFCVNISLVQTSQFSSPL